MKKKKIENILITGGAGYIGSHVAKQLEKHYKIYIIDNLSNGYKKLIIKNSKFLKGDIRNFNLVSKSIPTLQAQQHVLHTHDDVNWLFVVRYRSVALILQEDA